MNSRQSNHRQTRHKRTRNDIAMSYRIDSLGYGRVQKQEFFQRLIQFLDGDIAELPRGWRIIWRWQNSKKQDWREDTFENVVANSRDSFMTLMRRRLQRDLNNLSPTKRSPRKRKARKKSHKGRKFRKVPPVRKAKSRRGKTRKRGHRS